MASKKKHPHKWTLEEIQKLADSKFPPVWSVYEAVSRLTSFVDKCQNLPRTIQR